MLVTIQIIFNGEVVRPGFQKDGIAVSQVGIKMYVSIPELGVQVMFSGLIFSVEVPFSKFANNTEGQCGGCPAPTPHPPGSGPCPWSFSVAERVWCENGWPWVCLPPPPELHSWPHAEATAWC